MSFTWENSTPVNPTNLNKMLNTGHFTPAASTFNSTTGRTLTHNLGHQNYVLIFYPTADPGGNLGEVWYVKADNTVTIYNSGGFVGAFDYVIIEGEA